MALKEIEKLKEKVEKDPNSKLFVPLAEEYKKEGMLDEAIHVLLTGIERQPAYMSARVSLGKIYLEKGMGNEARAEFENVIKSIPDNLYAHKKLAEIYRDSGEKELAIRSYRTILRLNAMDEDAMACLRELEEGKPSDEVKGLLEGEHKSSEEGLLENHMHEVSSGEESPDDFQIDDVDAGLSEQTENRGNDLDAFKDSLFGGGDAEDDISEEIMVRDLPEAEDDVADLAGEDAAAGLAADIQAADEAPGAEEFSDVPGEISEAEDISFAETYTTDTALQGEEDAGEDHVGGIEAADRMVSEGDYGGAIRIYREILSGNPQDRRALQRMDELRSLLKMLGKDKEELIARLNAFLEGVQKRHNEFLGRT